MTELSRGLYTKVSPVRPEDVHPNVNTVGSSKFLNRLLEWNHTVQGKTNSSAEFKDIAGRLQEHTGAGVKKRVQTMQEFLKHVKSSYSDYHKSEWTFGLPAAVLAALPFPGRSLEHDNDVLFVMPDRIMSYDTKTQHQECLFENKKELFISAAATIGSSIVIGYENGEIAIWDPITRSETFRETVHSSVVNTIAVTSDGKKLISGSSDGTISVWNMETKLQQVSLTGHTDSVTCLIVTPDNQTTLSGSADGTIRAWNLVKGVEEYVLKGHTATVNCLDVTLDGLRIASGSSDKTAKIWNLKTQNEVMTLSAGSDDVTGVKLLNRDQKLISGGSSGQLILWNLELQANEATFEGHTSSINAVVINNNNQTMASSSINEIKIWNLETQTAESSMGGGHSNSVLAVELTSDGKKLISGGDYTVKVWDWKTGNLEHTFPKYNHLLTDLTVSRDGTTIVSSYRDGGLKVSSIPDKTEVELPGHGGLVHSVAITSDKSRAFSAGDDHLIKGWDLKKMREEFVLEGHQRYVNSIVVSHDDRRLVSGSKDTTVRVWDIERHREEFTLHGHTQEIWTVAITTNGRQIVSGAGDKQIKIWDFDSRQEIGTMTGHTEVVKKVAITPDGKRVVSGSEDKTVKVWDLENLCEEYTFFGHTGFIASVAVTPDGRNVVSGALDNTIKSWNIERRAEEYMMESHATEVVCLCMTPDGSRLISTSVDMTVKVWDMASRELEFTLTGHTKRVDAVVATPDGKRIVTGSHDQTVKIWSLDRREEECSMTGHTENIVTLAMGIDGKLAFSGSVDYTIRAWDLEKQCAAYTLTGHSRQVWALGVTPNNKFLVSTSFDQLVKVWNLETRAEEFTLEGHTDYVTSLAIGSDGVHIVTASDDRSVRVWNLEKRREEFSLYGHTEAICALDISPDCRHIISGSFDSRIKVWSMERRKEEFTLVGHTSFVRAALVSTDGRKIITGGGDGPIMVWDLEGFTTKSDTRAIFMGIRQSNLTDFYNYRFLGMNRLHFLSFFENPNLLDALHETQSGIAPVAMTSDQYTGLNPLEILMELNNRGSLRTLLEYSTRLPPFYIDNATRTFVLLFKTYTDMSLVSRAFDCCLRTFKDHPERIYGLPADASLLATPKVPMRSFAHVNMVADDFVQHGHSLEDHEFDFLSFERTPENEAHEAYVQVKMCDLVNFDSDDFDFFGIIAQYFPKISHPIYGTKMLATLLEYKWSQLRKYHTGLFMFVLTFCLLYWTYTTALFGDKVEETAGQHRIPAQILVVLLLLGTMVLFGIEVLQWKKAGSILGYLSNHWNFVDTSLVFSLLGGLVTDLLVFGMDMEKEFTQGDTTIEVIKGLYALIYLFLGVKIIYFLRGYSASSFLINMILQVFQDMATFLIIIVIVTVSFAGAFFMLQTRQGNLLSGEGESAPNVVFDTYAMLLGENDLPDTIIGDWVKVVFVLYTLFNLIVMLNLLIAVISDTFDKVQDSADHARNSELLQLVVEYEQLSRQVGQHTTFLYVFGTMRDEDEEDDSFEWKGRIKEITRSMKTTLRETSFTKVEMDNKLKEQEKRFREQLVEQEKRMEGHFSELFKLIKGPDDN